MVPKGTTEATVRLEKVFRPHNGHQMAFGRMRFGDKYDDSQPNAYFGTICQTCREVVDLTFVPKQYADLVDELRTGHLK
jgi:hypothetical protein